MVHEIPVDAVRCSDPTEEALKEREKTVITAGLGRAAPEVGTRGHAHLLNILFGLLPPLIVIRRQYISNFLRSILHYILKFIILPPLPRHLRRLQVLLGRCYCLHRICICWHRLQGSSPFLLNPLPSPVRLLALHVSTRTEREGGKETEGAREKKERDNTDHEFAKDLIIFSVGRTSHSVCPTSVCPPSGRECPGPHPTVGFIFWNNYIG